MQALDGGIITPPAELVVHVVPGRKVVGQVPPGASIMQLVEQSVHDFAQVMLARAACTSISGFGQAVLQGLPLGISQVSGVGFAAHAAILHHLY